MTLNSKRALTVAIDTSTDMLVCALRWADPATGEEQVLSRDHMCRRHANVELVNTVQSALAEAGFGIADVDTFVVGRGPGSFTGVRIGISTAKGLACGANVPLLGASTLDACAWTAWRAGERGLVGVVADAMRGEVYPALYRIDEERLSCRENERHVDANALGSKRVRCSKTCLADGKLDHDVGSECGKAAAFLNHALSSRSGGLGGNGKALAELCDLEHMRLEVRKLAARTGIQGRVGGDAG